MTLPLPEDEWKLKVNAQYQEGIKLLMSFVTAGLVLPIVLVRNFVGPDEMAARFLTSSAYIFWVCFFVSLLCGMLFYWASSKFVKVVCGGKESLSEKHFEIMRDVGIGGAVVCFFFGVVSVLWFFHTLSASHLPSATSSMTGLFCCVVMLG